MATQDQDFEAAKHCLTTLHDEARLIAGKLDKEQKPVIRQTILQRLRELRYKIFTTYCCDSNDLSILIGAMQICTNIGAVLSDNGIHEDIEHFNPLPGPREKKLILPT